MESNEDEGTSAADVNRSREPSNDGIQNSDQSNEATVPTQRQESMQQASQVLPKSSEARTLELEIQKLNLQIQYEKLLQARMNAERLNGTLSNSGSETGDQRRRGFDSVQQCAKVLKGFRLPSDADVPLWFEEVEKLFATYQVPHESRVHLVMPALTERVRYLLRNLNPEESADYESVKAAVLTELKLSPAEYLQRFERAVKRKEETWAQFASRVKTYFSYYLQVREADTVEVMAELMVADRIKSGLSTEGLEYVRLREGEGWLRPTEIAKVLQTFEQAKGKGRASKQPTVEMGQKPATRVEKGALKCHLCHGSGHFAKECPKASDKENNPKKATEPKRKVQKVTLSHETDTEIPTGVLSAKVKSLKHEGEGTDKLQLIPVSCAGISADAILDTGSEITVIRESLLPRSVVEPSGTVRLVSAFGKTIEARLATLPVKLNSPREVTEPQNVDLLCALTDELVEGTDCLLTKDDWKLLLKASSPLAPCRAPAEPAHEAEQAVEKQKVVACNLTLEEKDDSGEEAQTDEEREASLGQRVEFRNVQLGDTTLKKCWEDARSGKSGMFISDGLLYHCDSIAGTRVSQLVVPKDKRTEVMHLAHESLCGGHLGSKKTRARIRYNFFWPGMAKEILEHCRSCHECQIRSDKRRTDKVPITPLTRPEHPFQVVNVDVIGPLDTPSARGHKYALCLVDLCTRWPEVIPLRSLTAKATCDALIEIFSRTGVPEMICSDQGTNFKSQLTQTMLEKLGCMPRFSTPEHPESNGVVERWNRVLKNMLYHVIQRDSKNWDKLIPMVLWAYREVPHEVTGVAPFRLLYGRNPTGPLLILQKTWTGEMPVPATLRENPAKYLQQLKEQLETAANIAELTSATHQESYASAYNRSSRLKAFNVGDQVVVFDNDRSGKMSPKWLGPFTVVGREREHSYRVETSEGKVKSVHANNIRPYYARVSHIGVVFDEDHDFGEVEYAPQPTTVKREELVVTSEKVAHLDADAQAEIQAVFQRHCTLFDGTPGIAKVDEHKIEIEPGHQPKKAFPYRVPELLKKEVSRQVDELLTWKLIYPTESEFAHPVVCVGKKDGTIRMCVDYRALNAVTKADAFPMMNPQELIFRVGRAQFITVVDLRRGYWQVPMEEKSQKFTAFVTHEGQYAWKVMPFGLKNSAATFQRMVNKLLSQHQVYATAYLDDIAIFSSTWEEHLRHLDIILKVLEKAGLKASPEKCQIAQSHIHYLGHIVGSGTHAPDPEKIAAVKNLVPPRTKKELRSLLGLCGYYREYVRGYAEVTSPLTLLTKKAVPNKIPWPEEAQAAFETLKRSLCEAVALNTPEPSQPYWLFTDASATAAGACLAQMSAEGEEKPIAFASHRFSPTQMRWSTIEREAFAIIWALKKFDYWLFGAIVNVVSDHNPLSYLTTSTPHGAKLTRWALALQRYHVSVQHRKGVCNGNADALSRLQNSSWKPSE